MRLIYQRVKSILLLHLLALSLSSCLSPGVVEDQVQITILIDQERHELTVESESTVFDALEDLNIEIGTFDRVEPPSYTEVMEGMNIVITRVQESIKIENELIPFERQIIRNEALAEGEERLLQAGKNGVEEITYRLIEEQGEEPYQVIVERVTIREPVPEILMIGAKRAYLPANFQGSIVYVSAGNIWRMEGETGNRIPLLLTGDVDGRVFQLSSDGDWLLLTRAEESSEEGINSLWAIETKTLTPEPVELPARNIIHFADWAPSTPEGEGNNTVAYSTVEPRPYAPGWQANNDLILLTLNDEGDVLRRRQFLDTNPGGQYGWWGTSFSWSPDSDRIAFARADGIGILEIDSGSLVENINLTPYQTFGDWAWVPDISWTPDGRALFFVDHGSPLSLESPEASQVFHLNVVPLSGEYRIQLFSQVGMFSSVALSPEKALPSGELSYSIAYLQAIFPLESETSHYQLILADRDGSNRRKVFPPNGEIGLEPGRVQWSPSGEKLAIIYQNDLVLVDPSTGLYQPITADGQTIAFDWGP